MHFFIPHSFLLTLSSSLKILIVQWWFSIKKTKNAQTTLCTSYLRQINTMFHAIWRSSFNTTSPVGKNTKITFVEECIFIKMVARTDWFQNHHWIVNVICFKLCGTSQLTNNNKFNVFVFLLLKQFEKKSSEWLIIEFKINVQERKLVHSNNRSVPKKDRTYGTFSWKKTIAHVRLFSTRE